MFVHRFHVSKKSKIILNEDLLHFNVKDKPQ